MAVKSAKKNVLLRIEKSFKETPYFERLVVKTAESLFYNFLNEYLQQKNDPERKKLTEEQMVQILSPLVMCITINHQKIFTILANYARLPEEMREYLEVKLKKLLIFLKRDRNLI